MAIARELAGYTLGGADLLRRAMGKKKPEVLAAEWDKFHDGMRGNGFSEEAIKALWDVMLPFSGYAFNKSHTAGYGLVSYWTAYLKANYPAEYMAALLTSVGDDKDKAAIYLADARKNGVRVLQPDVNESVAEFTAVGDDVRFGLKSVRNVGDNVIEAIVDAPPPEGEVHFLLRLPRQGRPARTEQEGRGVADQGWRLRLPGAFTARASPPSTRTPSTRSSP